MATPSFRCLRNRREDCIGQFTAITWIIIHIFVLFHLPHLATGLEEPGFVSPLKNITTIVGRTTGFTCVTKNFGDHNTVRIIQGRHGTAGKAGKVWPLHGFWVSIHSYKKQQVNKIGAEYRTLPGSNLPWRTCNCAVNFFLKLST